VKIQLIYKVNEDDHSHMSSRELENESQTIEVSSKEEIIEKILSWEYITIDERLMKSLKEEDIDFNEEIDLSFDEDYSGNYMTTTYLLKIKKVDE
jgi:hypothetical protein